jgi:hypothetical protein
MSKLFISYRRTDSPDTVGRIYDRLAARFGEENIFRDIDSISAGTDFRQSISDAVQGCHVVLAVIGKEWLHAKDDKGKQRLDDPDDFVRIELETGLNKKEIRVIPVLINHAGMPTQEELPDSLKKLAYRHAVSIRPDPDFNSDIQRLVHSLNEQNGSGKTPSIPRRIAAHLHAFWIPYTVFVVLLASSILYLLIPEKPTNGQGVDRVIDRTDKEIPPEADLVMARTDKEIPTYLLGKWRGKIGSSFISYDIALTVEENSAIVEEKSPFSKCTYRLDIFSAKNGTTTFDASLSGDNQAGCIGNNKITLKKSSDSNIEYHVKDNLGLVSASGTLQKTGP